MSAPTAQKRVQMLDILCGGNTLREVELATGISKQRAAKELRYFLQWVWPRVRDEYRDAVSGGAG